MLNTVLIGNENVLNSLNLYPLCLYSLTVYLHANCPTTAQAVKLKHLQWTWVWDKLGISLYLGQTDDEITRRHGGFHLLNHMLL